MSVMEWIRGRGRDLPKVFPLQLSYPTLSFYLEVMNIHIILLLILNTRS